MFGVQGDEYDPSVPNDFEKLRARRDDSAPSHGSFILNGDLVYLAYCLDLEVDYAVHTTSVSSKRAAETDSFYENAKKVDLDISGEEAFLRRAALSRQTVEVAMAPAVREKPTVSKREVAATSSTDTGAAQKYAVPSDKPEQLQQKNPLDMSGEDAYQRRVALSSAGGNTSTPMMNSSWAGNTQSVSRPAPGSRGRSRS